MPTEKAVRFLVNHSTSQEAVVFRRELLHQTSADKIGFRSLNQYEDPRPSATAFCSANRPGRRIYNVIVLLSQRRRNRHLIINPF